MKRVCPTGRIAEESRVFPRQSRFADAEARGIPRLKRAAGILIGVGTHVLFFYTVYHLFRFLSSGEGAERGSLWWDASLSLQFAVIHSLLLLPATRRRLSRWIGREFYGLFFCVVTCVGLLLTFAWWKTSDVVIWELHSWNRQAVVAAFVLSWVMLFYSLNLSGLGWQTGLTPWWHWVRKQPPPSRTFNERGLYRVLRHPIYLSFLGLIWFTPVMTLDHAVLTGIWTVYIFVGSWLKDRRLEFFLGTSYREYESRVPGYPLMRRGPLGLRPIELSSEVETPESAAVITSKAA